VNFTWRVEAEPPLPLAVVGVGRIAHRLLTVAERTEPGIAQRWSVTANDDVLVVAGSELPWADGVQYVAPRAEAAALWISTLERPAVALDLLERAIQRRYPQQPLLLLREPAQLVPLTRLLPVSQTILRQIRKRWGIA
jgi:hypothetical protein